MVVPIPAAASSHDFWQDFLRADDPVLTAPSYQAGYPARLADGRHLLLPIRVLPGDGTRAVASLITNQASFRVLDAIADVLTAQVAQLGAEVVIGVPTLGLPLAEGLARRLGHPRMVALSTSRKFSYDEGLSEPLSSITSPQQSKRIYLDPRSLGLLADRRILLVDDVLSTGRATQSLRTGILRCKSGPDSRERGGTVCAAHRIYPAERGTVRQLHPSSRAPATDWPDRGRTEGRSPQTLRSPVLVTGSGAGGIHEAGGTPGPTCSAGTHLASPGRSA
jgi:adenine/guanine phosphoribosyltransferase-like PRPP-binding protein